MPADPDIQGAIRTLQGLTDGDAAPDHVRWVSASVTNLTTATGCYACGHDDGEARRRSPKDARSSRVAAADGTTIPTGGFDISLSVEGSRAKVLAFVTKIQQRPEVLPRLFAVKSVSLSVETAAPSTGGAVRIAADQKATASVKLKVITFGVAPEKAAADAAAAIAKVPAGAATTVPSGTSARRRSHRSPRELGALQ